MKKIKKVLLLGSGALKIGQAGEFDYSGSQAIKALKEEGIRVILVNPNIATVQTSKGMADEIYFLPVTSTFVTRIIEKERPDGILLSFGGQTALNCGLKLHEQGILKKYNVQVLGTPIQAITTTEDRTLFANHLTRLGLLSAKGVTVRSMAQAQKVAKEIGFPLMVRSGYALGGTGSGVVQNVLQMTSLLTHGFATSTQLILEESLQGWKEIEYEVVRDVENNCIAVCNMENMDPVGIHTGESIVVAPSQTLNNNEYYRLRQMSLDVIRSLRIVGECNIQFALHPTSGAYRIIEVNARLSRSSALASKATGYPLAYIATKLALGHSLHSLRNSMTTSTSAFFEPALDYCVVKVPRWDLDKFTQVDREIGSEMKSVGEVMAIGRSFEEAIQKAARELNDGYAGVIETQYLKANRKNLLKNLEKATSMRLFTIIVALYAGITPEQISRVTSIDQWFIDKLFHIVSVYKKIEKSRNVTPDLLLEAKQNGFSDYQIGEILHKNESAIRTLRKRYRITPVVKRIDTMAGEFPVDTNYLYMTYHGKENDHVPNKKKRKVIVLGCGPYAIGTSVEFDWCAVYASRTLRKLSYQSIMVNCNPETVSTDFDESDFLYFEELTLERILDIYDIEKSPVLVSVGGQIPNNLAPLLEISGVPILGTKAKNIFRAEHRKTFSMLLDALAIRQPAWTEVSTLSFAKKQAKKLGYPVLVRPSFVLSGKSMRVIQSEEELSTTSYPITMTKFLQGAQECDFDGVAKNGIIHCWAISEHVESGGVHSGDSSLILPPATIPLLFQKMILEASRSIVKSLEVHGPFNIQFLIFQDELFVIECNLRASRSFPFVSKAYDYNFITAATSIMVGVKVSLFRVPNLPYFTVKVPQFSFKKLRGADPKLHVEMASTGEVSAFGSDMWSAYLMATLASGYTYPHKKAVFLSLGGAKGKLEFLKGAHLLHLMGYTIFATQGTTLFLQENAIDAVHIAKIHAEPEGKTVLSLMQQKEIDFAVVTTESVRKAEITDGYIMRRMAIDMGVPIFTNSQSARLFIEGVRRFNTQSLSIQSWREYITSYET